MSVRVHHGDCLAVLPTLDAESVDACVTDPPYHLTSIVKRFGGADAAPAQFGTDGAYARASRGFMGKQWDGGDIAFRPETWAAVRRVMKPGAHLLAFSGTRTYHRMVCAIEDAGFDVRDQIGWCFGSGFPKSHNIGNGWGTALKPAWEPICLARKPLGEATIAANVLKHGTGALNIDGCRIGSTRDVPASLSKNKMPNVYCGGLGGGTDRDLDPNVGRWPANVIHDGSDEVLEAFARFGERRSAGDYPSDSTNPGDACVFTSPKKQGPLQTDAGTAARFFYTAKADSADRLGSKHPTVKPVDLIAYLCRLVTPPGGLVLDPFAGSGTTGMACLREGFDAVLIEREAEYYQDINRRIAHVQGLDAPLFAGIA